MPSLLTQIEKVVFIEVIATTILSETSEDPRIDPVFTHMREVIARVAAAPKKREVDCLYTDLAEWCRHSPVAMRKVVSSTLQRKVGRPLSYFEHARLARIERIVKRGKIRSDDEWRIVEERVQELCEEPDSSHETEILNQLLWRYIPKTEA